ncbi:MAG: hypothetical protein COA59_07770 [Colwellia sp.]|nr:MAG: hypothetical protein COA59_07770 [Colwellia sp.]
MNEYMQARLTFITLDVSALAPPEPMTIILTHLARLTAQECLRIKHRRQPFPLYEKLNYTGFSYHCVVDTQDDITLYIFHQNAEAAFDEWLVTSDLTKGKD